MFVMADLDDIYLPQPTDLLVFLSFLSPLSPSHAFLATFTLSLPLCLIAFIHVPCHPHSG